MPGNWAINGNLNQNDGVNLNYYHNFVYSNYNILEFVNLRRANLTVSNLKIFRLQNNFYEFRISAPNSEKLTIIVNYTRSMGISGLNITDRPDLYWVSLTIDILEPFAIAMLQAVRALEPTFIEIEPRIVADLGGINLNRDYILPRWLVTGSFGSEIQSGSFLNRELRLQCDSTDVMIKELDILGYSDNCYKIYIRALNRDVLDRIISQARARRLEIREVDITRCRIINRYDLWFEFDHVNPYAAIMLQVVRDIEPGFAEVQARVCEELAGLDLSQEYHVPNSSRQSTESSTGLFNSPVQDINMPGGRPLSRSPLMDRRVYHISSREQTRTATRTPSRIEILASILPTTRTPSLIEILASTITEIPSPISNNNSTQLEIDTDNPGQKEIKDLDINISDQRFNKLFDPVTLAVIEHPCRLKGDETKTFFEFHTLQALERDYLDKFKHPLTRVKYSDQDIVKIDGIYKAAFDSLIQDIKDEKLYQAVTENNVELVDKLIAANANIHRVSDHGYTPLDAACVIGNTKIVQALLRAGACAEQEQPRKLLRLN